MYQIRRAPAPIKIDGDLGKAVWLKAEKSTRFVDAVGGTPGIYDTRAAMLWDAEALYIAFWVEEPYPAATLTERDSLLWVENDLEVFIAGEDTYYEMQINAIGVIYEVFYLWRDAYPRFDASGKLVAGKPYFARERFDIMNNGAVSFGGNFDRQDEHFWTGINPRGLRWVYRNWDFPGLETAVKVDGSLNDPSVVSKGWTAELKFPWKGFSDLFGEETVTPKAGMQMRMFHGRYNLLHLNGKPVNVGWSWHPVGVADNHNPERFASFQLSSEIQAI
ncbi:MAG: carbohydrate-binding family 9-like protein [Bacteroidales bacterium]|nr:carbohydrate-binding family 9-like protein [Bacteroidales bacterium]